MKDQNKQPEQNPLSSDEFIQDFHKQQAEDQYDLADEIIKKHHQELGSISTSGLAEELVQQERAKRAEEQASKPDQE